MKLQMKILVTGGAGFIGSCFVRLALQDSSTEIVNVDKLTYAGNLENLAPVADHPNYRFFRTDICELDALRQILEETKPDAVVHFAAESHVDRSIFAPLPVFETNLRGTFNLLESLRACRIPRFILSRPMKYTGVWRRRSKPTRSFRSSQAVHTRRRRPDRICWRWAISRPTSFR